MSMKTDCNEYIAILFFGLGCLLIFGAIGYGNDISGWYRFEPKNTPQPGEIGMQEWLDDNPAQMYWNYDDRITTDQIDLLLESKSWEAIEETEEWIRHDDGTRADEDVQVKECLGTFIDRLLDRANTNNNGPDIEEDDVDIDELIDRSFDLLSERIAPYLEKIPKKAQWKITVNRRHTKLKKPEIIEKIVKLHQVPKGKVNLSDPDWEIIIEVFGRWIGFSVYPANSILKILEPETQNQSS